MKTTNRRRQEAHVRTQAVCVDHRDTLEATQGGKDMVVQLGTSVAVVKQGFTDQQRGSKEVHAGAAAAGKARRTLRARLKSIVRISRILKPDAGLAEPLRMPRVASDELLLADARMIAGHATTVADAFVAHGLPANVLTDLPAQIAALEQAKLAQAAGNERRLTANAAILTALNAGDDAIDALEAILVSASETDPNALIAWKNAKRVGPSRAASTTAETPAPAPATKVA